MHDFAALSPTVQTQIAAYPLDLLTTTHRQGMWAEQLPNATFMRLRGYTVLLPLSNVHNADITAKYIFLETNDPAIVLLLHTGASRLSPDAPMMILAVCVRVRDQQFYVATVYHHMHHAIGFDTWLYKGENA